MRASLIMCLIVVILLGTAIAQRMGSGSRLTFEDRKKQMLSRIEARIKSLEEAKKCVENAKNDDELSKCRGSVGAYKSPKGHPPVY